MVKTSSKQSNCSTIFCQDSDKTTADVPDFTKQLIENHPAPINHPSFEAEVPSQFADEPGRTLHITVSQLVILN